MSAVWKALHVSYVWTTGKRSDMYDPGLSVWSYPVRRPTRREAASRARVPGAACAGCGVPAARPRGRRPQESEDAAAYRYTTAGTAAYYTFGSGRHWSVSFLRPLDLGEDARILLCTVPRRFALHQSDSGQSRPPRVAPSFDVCRVSGSGHSFSHTVARRTLIAALSRLSQARWLHGFRPFPFPGGWRL